MSNVLVAWALTAHDQLTAAAAEINMDLRSVAALTLVEAHEAPTVDWLAPRVGLSQSATVRLVDRLEAAGWLRRRRIGREVALSATPGGRRLLRTWHARADSVAHTFTSDLNADQLTQLTAVLAATLEQTHRPREHADRTCRTCNWDACGSDCPVDRSVPDGPG
jgi:DNA-binding MarR family transcriptional regulator